MANDDDPVEPKVSGKRDLVPRPASEVILPQPTRGKPNLIARARAAANEKYFKARQNEIDAHSGMTRALDENMRARSDLQRTIIQAEEWDEERERRRIRTEYALEDMDLDDRLSQRKHELEMAERQRERERNPPTKPKKPNKRREDDFSSQAEEILRYGAAGPNMRKARVAVDALISERGGEANLTGQDRERIEMLFEVARRKDYGKS